MRRLFVLIAAAVFTVSAAAPVAAATVKKTDFKGAIMVRSAESLTLRPGEKYTFRIGVKNTGVATWSKTGTKFLSVYTYFPKYRTSVVRDTSWYRSDQPAKLTDTTVAPGQIGYFEFIIHAPSKLGTYNEGFWLAAEDFTWVDGTQFKIPIVVSNTVAVKPPPAPAPAPSPAPTPTPTPPPVAVTPSPVSAPLSGLLMIKSFSDRVLATGGQVVTITAGFKNTGTVNWLTRILRVRGTTIASASSNFVSDTWPNDHEPSRIREPISSGNIGYFTFQISAPAQRGDYTLPLKLVVDDVDVPGTDFDIPVTVTEDSPQLPTQEIPITTGGSEPNIRVGLWKPTGSALMSNSSSFEIHDASGALLTTIPAETQIEIYYNRVNGIAVVSSPAGSWMSAVPVRFVPTTPDALWRIPNFAGWDATAYENRFRGTMELNYFQPSDNVWLIEELPLEQYMRGLAETSNISHIEYQKALVVAARTYAYFVHSIGGKYALFDVLPSAADQVYRGYGSETIRPNVVSAVESTRGMLVTYNNEIVVTPYFSRSDGRTRSWQEVWCCKVKPWLVGVPAPHDAGLQLWGHGVGMSAHDALGWANDGKTYDWILNYFYTGTSLKKIY
jgi:hypothetical protein